jgi:hypothetical protein
MVHLDTRAASRLQQKLFIASRAMRSDLFHRKCLKEEMFCLTPSDIVQAEKSASPLPVRMAGRAGTWRGAGHHNSRRAFME